MRIRLLAIGLVGAALLLAGWALAAQYTRAVSLIVLATERDGWLRGVSRLHERPVVSRSLDIPTRGGPIRANAYQPEGGGRRPVVLVTGVHPDGIDDPRLVHFARSLAAIGLGTYTPELPDLLAFEVTPAVTDAIEDITSWVAAQQDPDMDSRVGLVGISFSGGLAIVAAGRDSVRDRVAFVLSIGGHGDLLRTLDALAGGILTETTEATTDAFGLAIVLASVAPLVVPPEQIAPLREWARTFLEAEHLLSADPRRTQLLSLADRLMAALPQPAATFAERARAADSAALRPHLLDHVRTLAGDPALSPERAPPPRAPIYLLHGIDDPVIPPGESLRLAEHLRPHVSTEVLLTPLLTHADVEPEVALRDGAALVAFLASMLRR